jgi:hypothetical protein
MSAPEINRPEILAEAKAAFELYEKALVTNDVATLNELFCDSPHTIRYGITECLYGYEQICSFRAARSPANLARSLRNTVITTYGTDLAIASTEFLRPTTPKIGRQMQTWMRMPEGWRVIAAHVSFMEG